MNIDNKQLVAAVKAAMTVAATNQSDFEVNLRSIKGPEYTDLVRSVAAVMSSSGLMAKSMCTGIPLDIRETIALRFGTHINILIDCILARYCSNPVLRKGLHTEFVKNCMIFVNSNEKLEESVQAAVLGHLEKHSDDDAMDNNGDNCS